MILEFNGSSQEAILLSRAVRGVAGPECSVKTIEVWMHEQVLLAQHVELTDAIHEIRREIAFIAVGTAA